MEKSVKWKNWLNKKMVTEKLVKWKQSVKQKNG